MSKFTYVELFAGIGGFRQALDEVGGKCVFASEIDKFAQQSYKAIYGDEGELHGDITKINAKDVPDHDVMVGGFPCQSFSVAGSRGGFDDARGTLFFEIARIMDEKKPKVALLENVKGLVGHDKGKTLDTVVKTLNQIGYRVDFEVLNSKYFGVPQNRERIFIVAVREDLVPNEEWHLDGTNVVLKGKKRIKDYDDVKTFNFNYPNQESVKKVLKDILDSNVDDKYYLSEERTREMIKEIPESKRKKTINKSQYIDENLSIKNKEESDQDIQFGVIMDKNKINKVTEKSHCLMARDHKGFGNQGMTGVVEVSPFNETPDNQSYAITTRTHACYLPSHIEKKKASLVQEVRPVLTPDRQNKRQEGRRFKEDGDEAFTINTQDRHGVAIGTETNYRIRKLTPLECWRLQGFSDEDHQKAVDAGVSDSQRYKQAGNAVTVNVIQALAVPLLTLIKEDGNEED